MLKSALVFCAMLVLSSAFLEQMALEPIPEKFKDQTGCYIKELDVDVVLPFGTSSPSKERCVEYRCKKNLITMAGCSVVVAQPPCEVVEDTHKQYPDCCPTVKCP